MQIILLIVEEINSERAMEVRFQASLFANIIK